MILTPIHANDAQGILEVFDTALRSGSFEQQVFRRIAATRTLCPDFSADLFSGRSKALDLANAFGIPTIDEDPAGSFSWDGTAIRTRSETSVVYHEIAHWQVAPLARRSIYDFGLGAGPETGLAEDANAVACTDLATRENEENLASLLGILWEVEFGEPALLAFAEQNWLELYDRPGTQHHFTRTLRVLRLRRLIDADGRPCGARDFSFSPHQPS